jgi:hypothetical protein
MRHESLANNNNNDNYETEMTIKNFKKKKKLTTFKNHKILN